MLSMWQIIIVVVILLIFFGPSRIEKLGPSLGKAIKGFKKGLDEATSDDKEVAKKNDDPSVVEIEPNKKDS